MAGALCGYRGQGGEPDPEVLVNPSALQDGLGSMEQSWLSPGEEAVTW